MFLVLEHSSVTAPFRFFYAGVWEGNKVSAERKSNSQGDFKISGESFSFCGGMPLFQVYYVAFYLAVGKIRNDWRSLLYT